MPVVPKNVLIVEDQALVRAGMTLMLHIADPHCRIVGVGSHADALGHLAEERFDVVFLDIDLGPAASGIETLRYIRDHGLPAKVIMLSGTEDRETVMKCIAAGASGYIVKGQGDETVFARALATVFDEGVFLPASVIGGDYGVARAPRTAPELGLSPRMCEVLYYACQGLTNKAIANRLGISEGTVRKDYISELLRFFNVARRTELIVEVARRCIRVPAPRELRPSSLGQ